MFLNVFKQAKIRPIFKKGNPLDVNNYRTISLLPALSKILEEITHKRLYSFLTRQKFFHKLQFGFRTKHSTNHATTALVEYICKAFVHKEYAIGVFLVLSKAIDTIDHSLSLPLSKLYKHGVRGSARASERKFFRGYEGRYRAPKSYWAPQALLGPMPLNHFCPMGVDLHLKTRGNDILHTVRTYEKHS